MSTQREALTNPASNYHHGPGTCRQCFSSNLDGGLNPFVLKNNPGYYGSSEPDVLVLGFSKGANQNKIAETGDFDAVAFANCRPRLAKVLDTLGIMPRDRSIDQILSVKEAEAKHPQIGVASLVRCSFGKLDDHGNIVTSGPVVTHVFRHQASRAVVHACLQQHMLELPSSAKLVVLLGTNEQYITRVKQLFRRTFADYVEVNHVAFAADGRTWVFAGHPSPGNGYFNAWLSCDPDRGHGQGEKAALARHTVAERFLNTRECV